MSDNITQTESSWQSSLTLIYPVIGAVILVILVFFFGVGASPEPIIPESFIEENKRSKPKKKKTAKPETKPETIQSLPNGDSIKTQKPASKDVKKSKPADSKSKLGANNKKTAVKKPAVKKEKTAAEIQREKERAEARKELATGDWVTVSSVKEKKPKKTVSDEPEIQTSQQPAAAPKPVTVTTSQPAVSQTYTGKRTEAEIIAEAQAILAQKGAQTSQPAQTSSLKTEKTAETTSKLTESKPSNRKSKSKFPEPAAAPKEQQPQVDVRPKSQPVKPVAKVEPQPTKESKSAEGKTGSKSEQSIQEKIEDAMKPAFDELGEWEQAKPQKMKNMKKRARKEK